MGTDPEQCRLVRYVQQRVAAAWHESEVPLSDTLLHRIHRNVVVIASDGQMRPVWVESQAADGPDSLAHEAIVIFDVVDQLPIAVVDGCELVHGATGDQVCLGVDVEGCQPLHNLHYIHRLRHPRIEESHISIDTAREDQVMLAGGILRDTT